MATVVALSTAGHGPEDEPVSGPREVPAGVKGGTERCARRRAARLEQQRRSGLNLAHARTALGLSVQACADRAGISRARWRAMEEGRAGVSVPAVRLVSTELWLVYAGVEARDQTTLVAEPRAEDSLPELCKALGEVADILEDRVITPQERPKLARVANRIAVIADRLGRAAQGTP